MDCVLKVIEDVFLLLDCVNNLSMELVESCKEGKDEDLVCRVNLFGGNLENLEVFDNGINLLGSSIINIFLNGLKDEIELRVNDSVIEILNND